MDRVTLANRPATQAPLTRIEDFLSNGLYIRVSLKRGTSVDPDSIPVDVQAFEVDATGAYVAAPDGRPSRTYGTVSTVLASSLGDTHTWNPGWVRVVGTYDDSTFEVSAPRGIEKPTAEPDWLTNPTGKFYDTAAGVGYKWDDGEVLRIARAKATELENLVRNSGAVAGTEF